MAQYEIVSFGEWVQTRRNQLRYTRKALADLVSCSAVTIKKIERDERRPSPEIAALLARHLQIPNSEIDKFIARARGEFVSQLLSPTELSWTEAQAPITEGDIPKQNLPPQPTSFLGRTQELAKIAEQLALPDCRLLTILGAGGMGKTRLGIEAARMQGERFTDGIVFVDLAPLSPAESPDDMNPLFAALADSLNIGFYGNGNPEQQLLAYLQRTEKLLVFDNFEHLLESAGFLSNILNLAPEVKILVTSRERLNLQEEWLFPLTGLAFQLEDEATTDRHSEAAQLFVQRARQVHPAFDAEAELGGIQKICQLVEGMPLGVELAAAWVTQLSCQEIAEEIKAELDFLSTDMRNVPDRHRSIRAAFGHSWEKLAPKERDVLQKLSVFRGGFERKGAYAVAGASLTILAKLVSKSLLSVGNNGRYQIHELLRQFAAERLAETPQTLSAVQSQHSRYYFNFVGQQSVNLPGNTDFTQFTNTEPEIDNIRSAMQHALFHAPELFCNLAVWEVVILLFDIRGLYQEGIQLTEAVFNAVRPLCLSQQQDNSAPLPLACRYAALYLMAKASCQRRLRQFDRAEKTIEQACLLLPTDHPGLDFEWAMSRYYRAFVAFGKGDHVNAEIHFTQAIALAKRIEPPNYTTTRLYAMCLVIYGQLMYTLGDYQKAGALIEAGYAYVEELGDRGMLAALTLNYKAGLAALHGEYADSEQFCKSALEMIMPIRFPAVQNMLYRNLAIAVGYQGRLAEAHAYIQEHTRLAQEANLPFQIYSGPRLLGSMAIYMDEFATGLQIFQTLPPAHQPTHEPYLGWAYLGMGDVTQAKSIFLHNLNASLITENTRLATEALAGMATVKARSGQLKQALTLIALAMEHKSISFRDKQKAKKLWDELEAELPASVVKDAEARGKSLDLLATANSLLAEGEST